MGEENLDGLDALTLVDRMIDVLGVPALLTAIAKAASIKSDDHLLAGNRTEAYRWRVNQRAVGQAAAATS